MNYHFNFDTVEQLIHLIQDQTIHIQELQYLPENQHLIIPFTRTSEPNADKYLVHFEHVVAVEKNFQIHSTTQNPQVLKGFIFEPGKMVANLVTTLGEVRISMNQVKVLAQGSLPAP